MTLFEHVLSTYLQEKIRERKLREGKKNKPEKYYKCEVCGTEKSNNWYRKSTGGYVMCTKCGWYYRKHGVCTSIS